MKLADIVDRLRDQAATLTFANDKGAETVRTFHQLHGDTLAVVERLKALGVVPGCRIGIAGPSAYEWIVWDLACIAMQCVSFALPNEKPEQNLSALIDKQRLTALALAPGWHDERTAQDERIVALAVDDAMPRRRLQARVAEHAAGTHSLVFSSGTTGKTKGLIISAPGTERLLDLYHGAFGVEPGERLLTFLPFANYQQRMVYYFCLYHRIDFVSVPFPALFPSLKKHRPTFIIAPPIFYETLQSITQASVGAQNLGDTAALSKKLSEFTGGNFRYMITGMAPIKRAALDFFWRCGFKLYEAFGLTEAGMAAWNKPGCVRVGTVGKPAEPGTVSLSDEGEVLISRDALLSLGYFESSEEDARMTFIGHDTVATGDIAQFDEDGFLTIVGRKKDAIITPNGEKFHPEPIESQIHQDPRVAVAVVWHDGGAGLSAVISTKHHADADALDALRAHVATVNRALPAQQQVKRLVFTDRDFTVENGLRTKNMKLHRKAIAAAFAPQAQPA